MVAQAAQAAPLTQPRNLLEASQALRLAHALAAMAIHRLHFAEARAVAVALRTHQMPVQMAVSVSMAVVVVVGLRR